MGEGFSVTGLGGWTYRGEGRVDRSMDTRGSYLVNETSRIAELGRTSCL